MSLIDTCKLLPPRLCRPHRFKHYCLSKKQNEILNVLITRAIQNSPATVTADIVRLFTEDQLPFVPCKRSRCMWAGADVTVNIGAFDCSFGTRQRGAPVCLFIDVRVEERKLEVSLFVCREMCLYKRSICDCRY